ncbi:variable surface lipoprotein [Mycoplasma struthionis]|uniref:Variable surface lipoprotein n=1 Tax=Mycoplasma struthionis TaxID=538220 RepID=A0A3G8LGS2_9MOLU|nr:variable surface lipoprotein [Mycoplasma struthionis]AZG68487.1 hypothetical protein EGN60_00655 [Mycoplasma struthionis]
MKKSFKILLSISAVAPILATPVIAASCTKEKETKTNTVVTPPAGNEGKPEEGNGAAPTVEKSEQQLLNEAVTASKPVVTLTAEMNTELFNGLKDGSYGIWYERNDKKLVFIKSQDNPVWKAKKDKQVNVNDFASLSGINLDNYQLANAKEPIYKETNISAKLDYTFTAKTENAKP